MTTEQIARVCHEANRALCLAVGDGSQAPWDYAPAWQRKSAMAGVEYAQQHPEATPADQHDAWCAQKVADGWIRGHVKDAVAKTHPCLVPYDLLPEAQRAKDVLFQAIVRALGSLDAHQG